MVKCLMNNFVCVLSSDYSMDYILLHVLHCILSNDSRVGKSDEGLMSAFKVFILHAGHCDSSSFFPLKKHAVKQFKQNLCSHFNTFIGFLHFCVINIIQFHFRWNIIRFYLRRKKIKKAWNLQVESLAPFFGLPFWAAFTLSILLPIIPFWSSWTLANFTFFTMSSPVVLNGDVLIVLCLLMVVDMTE